MTYDEKIPEFAMQPAKSAGESPEPENINNQFDITPYDRLLTPAPETETIMEPELTESELREPEKAPEKIKDESAQEPEKKQGTEEINNEPEEIIDPVILKGDSFKEEKDAEPVTVTPLSGDVIYSDLKVTTVSQSLETNIFVEEDILVPDIKPDLISILSMDGKAYLSSKEIQLGQDEGDNIRVTGEILLQTIYLPDGEEKDPVSLIQTKIPFKTDWQVSASPLSHLSIIPIIEKVEHSVINERKFRAKITVKLYLKEYAEKEIQLFDGLKNEKLELLKEPIKIGHITARKEESAEISEDLKIKESGIKPLRILKTDINIVENHKQITAEKIVLNANIWVSVLYMAEEETDDETILRPAFFQGKTDFTQFVLLNKDEPVSAVKITFSDRDLELKINEDEEGFNLSGSIKTSLEVSRNIEKEIVSDLYHNVKDMTYDFTEKKMEAIIKSGVTEVSAREIFNIPEVNGPVKKVIYVNGYVKDKQNKKEKGRVAVEGMLEAQIICIPEGENKHPFAVKQDIPFRGSIDIQEAEEKQKIESRTAIKELWFDKINGNQVEVNASLQIETDLIEEKSIKLIKNPCFVESSGTKHPASMVIYITKKEDTLWSIAKKYKTGMDMICRINHLEDHTVIKEGMRLLIVK